MIHAINDIQIHGEPVIGRYLINYSSDQQAEWLDQLVKTGVDEKYARSLFTQNSEGLIIVTRVKSLSLSGFIFLERLCDNTITESEEITTYTGVINMLYLNMECRGEKAGSTLCKIASKVIYDDIKGFSEKCANDQAILDVNLYAKHASEIGKYCATAIFNSITEAIQSSGNYLDTLTINSESIYE